MAEIFFYHLERQNLKGILPTLLEKCLEKNWRACVEVGEGEDLAALDTHLWTYRDDSFLPHGKMGDAHEAEQPIMLTHDETNPNQADVRLFVGRAAPRQFEGYERLIYVFDGTDPEALTEARQQWKKLKADHDLTYWQQTANGGWRKQG